MSRLAHLVRHPRRTLAVLATVTTAVGITVASGADFTASSANPANTFSTGTLTMSNSRADAAVLTATGLRPGDTKEGTVDIENTGSLGGVFTLARGAMTNTDATNPLAGKLNVVIDDCGAFTVSTDPVCGDGNDVNKYTGTIADMGTTGHPVASLGTFSGGDKHRYRFRVTLDTTAGNAYQGDSSTTEFTWAAA
jgi:hypothetical protein